MNRRTCHPSHLAKTGCCHFTAKNPSRLELDFAPQKKGVWPSRPCGDWSTCSHHSHRNQRSSPQHTGGTHCAPLLEPKSKLLLVLDQIVKKVGTPRRRCPKQQARRAVSGIQRRLHPSRCATTAWQVMRERRTAAARHPYQFGKGHGRLGRVEIVLLARALPIGTKGADRSTQAGRTVPLSWSPKASYCWYNNRSRLKSSVLPFSLGLV